MSPTEQMADGVEAKRRRIEQPMFTGVIPALITPFTKENTVDTAAVPALINHLLSKGVSGFYVCGSTGEAMHMSVAERKLMTEVALKAVAGRVPCMVMVGACPIADAVDLAKHAADAGAVAISTVAPGVYASLKLTDSDEPAPEFEATISYFANVAAATSLPFYAYWLGDIGTTDPRQFLGAMKGISNFKGLKFTLRDFYLFERIMDLAPEILGHRLNMISGPDECHLAGAAVGSDAAIGSTYNYMPGIFVKLRTAFESGDMATARLMQTRANRVIDILLDSAKKGKKLSGLAGMKAFMREVQNVPAGFCKKASTGEEWTNAMEADFVAQYKSLDFKIE